MALPLACSRLITRASPGCFAMPSLLGLRSLRRAMVLDKGTRRGAGGTSGPRASPAPGFRTESLARGTSDHGPCPRRRSAGLDSAFQVVQRGPHDLPGGLTLDQPRQRHAELDVEAVGHPGGVLERLEVVRAAQIIQRALAVGPGDARLPRRVPVGERVLRGQHGGAEPEGHHRAPAAAVALQDLDVLHVADPVRIGLEVRDHLHDFLGACLDVDRSLGVLWHWSLHRVQEHLAGGPEMPHVDEPGPTDAHPAHSWLVHVTEVQVIGLVLLDVVEQRLAARLGAAGDHVEAHVLDQRRHVRAEHVDPRQARDLGGELVLMDLGQVWPGTAGKAPADEADAQPVDVHRFAVQVLDPRPEQVAELLREVDVAVRQVGPIGERGEHGLVLGAGSGPDQAADLRLTPGHPLAEDLARLVEAPGGTDTGEAPCRLRPVHVHHDPLQRPVVQEVQEVTAHQQHIRAGALDAQLLRGAMDVGNDLDPNGSSLRRLGRWARPGVLTTMLRPDRPDPLPRTRGQATLQRAKALLGARPEIVDNSWRRGAWRREAGGRQGGGAKRHEAARRRGGAAVQGVEPPRRRGAGHRWSNRERPTAMEDGVPLPRGPVVGTCGFGYQEWRGRFYPPELTSAKVPRAITHEARLEGEAAAVMLRLFAQALEPLGDRLLAVVLQLPPSLGAGEGRERLARLLGTRPDGLPVVVEFRHRSWDRPWLGDLLAGAGAELALADRPGEPPWPAWKGPVRYLRLLGDRQATPVIGRPVRDRSVDLDRWARLLSSAGGGDRPAAAFANNRFEGAGFVTAAELRRRLRQPAPDPKSLWPEPPLPGFDL